MSHADWTGLEIGDRIRLKDPSGESDDWLTGVVIDSDAEAGVFLAEIEERPGRFFIGAAFVAKQAGTPSDN
jgi:hypothetical protein